MTVENIQSALNQVRAVQQHIIERNRFRGYCGKSRIASGCLALGAAIILWSCPLPTPLSVHLLVWGFVGFTALLLNYGALFHWFLYNPASTNGKGRVKPVIDVIPPLFVGGLLTISMIQINQHDLLFGIWMCLFGLANLATRQVLPKAIGFVGTFYLSCGSICLMLPSQIFIHPWYMGVVFFIGEGIAGFALYFDQSKEKKEFQ